MGIHIKVHRRCNKHWSFGRQVGSYQHVIRYSIGHFTDGGSRSRRYQHGIRPQPQIHMTVPRTITLSKKLADDRLARQCRQCDRSYKLFPRRRDDNLHFRTPFYQSANNVTRLICSDTTRNS